MQDFDPRKEHKLRRFWQTKRYLISEFGIFQSFVQFLLGGRLNKNNPMLKFRIGLPFFLFVKKRTFHPDFKLEFLEINFLITYSSIENAILNFEIKCLCQFCLGKT